MAIPGANVNDVDLCENRTFRCGPGGGCFWKEEEKDTTRINHMRFDQIEVANPETLAVGCPFCMTMMETRSNRARSKKKCASAICQS
jgi:Fe-S oxidoreductase